MSHRLVAAHITCSNLKHSQTRYSNLNPYAVVRWYISNQRSNSTPGKKVNLSFEKEVKGSMVISQLLETEDAVTAV